MNRVTTLYLFHILCTFAQRYIYMSLRSVIMEVEVLMLHVTMSVYGLCQILDIVLKHILWNKVKENRVFWQSVLEKYTPKPFPQLCVH